MPEILEKEKIGDQVGDGNQKLVLEYGDGKVIKLVKPTGRKSALKEGDSVKASYYLHKVFHLLFPESFPDWSLVSVTETEDEDNVVIQREGKEDLTLCLGYYLAAIIEEEKKQVVTSDDYTGGRANNKLAQQHKENVNKLLPRLKNRIRAAGLRQTLDDWRFENFSIEDGNLVYLDSLDLCNQNGRYYQIDENLLIQHLQSRDDLSMKDKRSIEKKVKRYKELLGLGIQKDHWFDESEDKK